jgi:hypothetical protein
MYKFNTQTALHKLSCKITLRVQGRTNTEGKFDWGNAVVDASILSGITFFTGLTALAGSHALSVDSLCILSSSVGVEFLTFLSLKRGLIPQSQQKNAPAKPLRT